jgi:hypothetical protein
VSNKYETYNTLADRPVENLQDLQGRVLSKVVQLGDDELRFHLTDDYYVKMYHSQDCCESVTIEDIVGDLDDLVGTPLLMVEESVSHDNDHDDSKSYSYDDSNTWTFYRFRTIKGSVDIRWHGSSNGYYSESVDIAIVERED